MRTLQLLVPCLLLLLFSACATNPVTGKAGLSLIGEQQEIQIGTQNYPFQQQLQGGEWILDPDLSRYVEGVGQKLAQVSDRPNLPYEFVILNDGTWNAWAMPGGKIAIHRGLLLALNNESELAAVLAHEIVHAAARHTAQQIERGMWMQIGVVGLAGLAGPESQVLVQEVGGLAAGLTSLRYSREAESEADYYGIRYMVKAGYHPEGAVTLQETFLQKQNNAGGWLASHPGTAERVRKNRAALAAHPGSGYVGEAEYRIKTRPLRTMAPAYDLYEKGLEALAKKNPAEALRLSLEARSLEPREGLFYGLSARAHAALGKEAAAAEAWDQALRRNPNYFYFWLERGLLREKRGDKAGAREDLRQSFKLLPTQQAKDALQRLGG